MKNYKVYNLKRLVAFSLFVSIVLCQFGSGNITTIYAATTPTQNQYLVMLNDSKLSLTLPILNTHGQLMYPFREDLEAMGATVDWIAETETAKGMYGDCTVEFVIVSRI